MESVSKIELSELASVYGNLLTAKQRDAVAMYCDCDCSLGEIAEDSGISRQGVRAALIAARKTLVRMEECLHLVRDGKQRARVISELLTAADSGDVDKMRELARALALKE